MFLLILAITSTGSDTETNGIIAMIILLKTIHWSPHLKKCIFYFTEKQIDIETLVSECSAGKNVFKDA